MAVANITHFRFQAAQDTQCLGIPLKTPTILRKLVQSPLPVVAIGRMPNVMTKTRQLSQISVHPEPRGNASTDLGHLKAMG